MHLDGIPTLYLIPDPSMLLLESIRFFNIDTNWCNAFLDGALSCANHTTKSADDKIRHIIKIQFERYLQGKFLVRLPVSGSPKEELHLPQVPVFGFFLRSKMVSAFRDLIVEIPFNEEEDTKGKAPILVQKRLGSDILIILLDRRPEAGAIPSIKFTQPPHQQRFCVADYLGDHEATYVFRQLTHTQGDHFLDQFNEEVTYQPDNPDSIYDWNSRCLNFQKMERLLFSTAYTPPGLTSNPYAKFHQEKWPVEATRRLTSAFLGIQLNDTMKYLSILPPLISPRPALVALAAAISAQDDLLATALEADRNLEGSRTQPPSSSFHDMAARVAKIKSLRPGNPTRCRPILRARARNHLPSPATTPNPPDINPSLRPRSGGNTSPHRHHHRRHYRRTLHRPPHASLHVPLLPARDALPARPQVLRLARRALPVRRYLVHPTHHGAGRGRRPARDRSDHAAGPQRRAQGPTGSEDGARAGAQWRC